MEGVQSPRSKCILDDFNQISNKFIDKKKETRINGSLELLQTP